MKPVFVGDGSDMMRRLGLGALSLMAGCCLLLALWMSYNDKVAAAATIGVLGLLLLVFLQLSRFKKVRGLGFEAELWEDKQIEAEAIIDRTRKVLTSLSTAMLTAAPRMGRWSGGFSRRELLDLAKELEESLQAAGVPAPAIGNVYSEIDKFVAFDLARPICETFKKHVDKYASEMGNALSQRLGSPIRDNEAHSAGLAEIAKVRRCAFKVSDFATIPASEWSREMQQRIRASHLPESLRDEVLAATQEDLLDLLAFTNGRNIRRPEKFFAENEE